MESCKYFTELQDKLNLKKQTLKIKRKRTQINPTMYQINDIITQRRTIPSDFLNQSNLAIYPCRDTKEYCKVNLK